MADPHQLAPDDLPTPFTAEEIREGCPRGRTLRYRHERPGQPPIVRVSRYVSGDRESCVQESWQESLDGERLTEPQRHTSTWLELQRHASFPMATTRRDEDELDILGRRLHCLRYTRVDDDGTWRFWFARELPGGPVRFEQHVDGQLTFSATLLE